MELDIKIEYCPRFKYLRILSEITVQTIMQDMEMYVFRLSGIFRLCFIRQCRKEIEQRRTNQFGSF